MGSFAVPAFVKTQRRDKRYLFLGVRFNRDSERMVMSDLMYGAARPAGWVLIAAPTDKERRFCEKLELEMIDADCRELLAAPPPAKSSRVCSTYWSTTPSATLITKAA